MRSFRLRRPATSLVTVVLVLVLPATAAAQREPFFTALLNFYQALPGVYGDEGGQLTAHLETGSRALEEWDAAIRAAEREAQARLPGADTQTALEVHTVLASMYLERGRFADAVRELDADLKIDPRRAAFHRLRGLALQALGRTADAAAAYRSAWLLAADDPQNAYYLIVHPSPRTTAAERQRAVDTLAALEKALVAGTRPAAGAPFLSVRPIPDDASESMAFAPARYAHPFALVLEGRLDEAVSALKQIVPADPLVADPALRLEGARRGIAALRQAAGPVDDAVRELEDALALAPASAQLHRLAGTARLVAGDLERAVEHLRQAVRLDPRDERSWLALARALEDAGDWTAAAEVLRAAVDSLPDAGELRWRLSTVSGRRQRTDQADLDLIASADRLVVVAGRADFLGRIAGLAQAHLEYDHAVALLEQSVALRPNGAAAHQALGRADVEQGREDEGYAELVVALWLDPANADTLTAIGRVHLGGGRTALAVEALTRAAALAQARPDTINALGEAVTRAGRPEEGRRHLAEAERLRVAATESQRRQRSAGMLALEAEVHLTQGRYDQAIAAWQQVITLQGRSAEAHERLAGALIAARRFDEAAAQLRMAIAAGAGADVHRRLAAVYDALGRAEDSARERATYTDVKRADLRSMTPLTAR